MTKRGLVAAAGVLALAAGIVAWREADRPYAPGTYSATSKAQVVLFVDMSEEAEADGCGAIIRAVRAAAKRGVVTEEVDTRVPGDRAKAYRLLIAPAVVVLDGSGRELRRFEGEGRETIEEIRAALERVVPPER